MTWFAKAFLVLIAATAAGVAHIGRAIERYFNIDPD